MELMSLQCADEPRPIGLGPNRITVVTLIPLMHALSWNIAILTHSQSEMMGEGDVTIDIYIYY